jgi:hypothetical protein
VMAVASLTDCTRIVWWIAERVNENETAGLRFL